ncbi:NADPH:quinone reductase-like Zn-dependent oxidoreductase [Roseiarcus fermentans]|uniref:NADPH:quinone reductase-like Zn-dependent oxidoreductase n=1 Tax=Roseiarcus fermentans TaxID=1473586 RepID=A0A366F116_9HYPH|nr:NADP-dependent oxidoreductase [Roseiarcus fermentans]RBP07405.1 NADPH:quinone reductase-like Zn-dependent oxidoreductase [Roseiarcus fermentans]
MKRVQYFRYGGPEELRLDEAKRPEPGRGQVRVQVRAASLNPMDWKIRRGELKALSGFRFPRGLGHDFAGVVDAVGPGAERIKVGDHVFGVTSIRQAGAFAECVVADEKNVWRKPPSVSFEQAAALTIVGLTAWNALAAKASLSPGQSVLVTGCLGGVGRSAVQIARMRGAEVVGSCSASGRAEALALGVGEVVDYRAFDVASFRRRFDVVFDTAGALSLSQCGAMLKRGGLSLHIVPTVAKMIGSLLPSRHHLVFGDPTLQSLAGVADAAEQGKLVPAIGRIVQLSEAIPAMVELERTGLPKGKLVIAPMR